MDGSDPTSVEKSLDVARSIVITKLSNALYEESPDSFNNNIYALLEKAFSMPKDAVERIIKYPQLNPDEEEFACKCLVSFRSRVHKHRVIAQKARLEAPTTIETITEIPKEVLEAEEELEVADEYTGEDEENLNGDMPPVEDTLLCASGQKLENLPPESDSAVQNANSSENGVKAEPEAGCTPEDPAVINGSCNEDLTHPSVDDVAAVAKPLESSKFVEYDEDEAVNPEEDREDISMEIGKGDVEKGASQPVADAVVVKNEVKPSVDDAASGNKDVEEQGRELNGKVNGSELNRSVSDAEQAEEKKELPALCKVDNHKEHFMTLPICWDGAPEFQWRTVRTLGDRRTLIIENVFWSDVGNVWLYPVIVRASEVRLNFEKQGGDVNEYPGRLELKFMDETVVISCAINYLVHVRTTRGRRLKIFLPQTKAAVRLKNDLEQRLGRVREPNEVMCQLIVKPVEESVTEDQVRDVAFRSYRIQRVEFRVDSLGQRCAVVTFGDAVVAAAAHLANEFVHFEEAHSAKWSKVYYPYVMMRQVGGDGLLTRWEYKKFIASEEKSGKVDKEKSPLPSIKAAVDQSSEDLSEIDKEDDENEVDTKSIRNPKQTVGPPKKPEKMVKKKFGQKRSFQPSLVKGSPPWKKMRRDSFGPSKGRPGDDLGHSIVPSASEVKKPRLRFRGKRGGKRQLRGGGQINQGVSKNWRPGGGMNGSNVASHQDSGIPTPLLSRDDYAALNMSGQGQTPRSFPKKGKQRNAENFGSRSSLGYKRGGSRPQFRSAHQTHEVVDAEVLMEERIREQRKQLALQEELIRRRMLDEMDHAPGRSSNSARYGNPPSLGYGRSSGDYRDDSFNRGLEGVGDLSHARPSYEMNVNYDRDPWSSYDDYSNSYGERSGRSADRSSYSRSRQSDGLPYGSVWR